MNLDEAQRKKVAGWIAEGLRLSDIQNRLASELGVSMTYMEVRLLVDDLKLTPKDMEPPKPASSPLQTGAAAPPIGSSRSANAAAPTSAAPAKSPAAPTGVSISVDQIARLGAVVSGKVTFGDGNQAEWYFDEAGRLGLAPQQPGYRPSAAELQQFQRLLENELSKMGY
jgi:hypothetical protein